MLQKRVVKWRNSAKNGHKRVCEWCGKTAYKHNKRLEFVSNFNLEASIRKKPDDGTADREIMTVKLASEYISIHITALYRYIRSGILKAIHLPGKTLVRKSDIEAPFSAMEEIPERSESPREKKPAEYADRLS